MENKQLKFWFVSLKYLLSPQNIKTYRKLTKNYDQELFELYTNNYIKAVLNGLHIEYKIHGKENLIDEPALYIFNHNSMFDSYFSYPVVKRHSYFIAHEFAFSQKVPIIKNYMKWSNSIFVNRNSLKDGLKSIKEGSEQLKKGNNLCIFAEGELTHLIREDNTQIVGNMHSGSFKPAKNNKIPVVPVAIIGSDKIHTSSSIFGKITSSNVDVYIGKPNYEFVNNENMTTQEMSKNIREDIVKMINDSKNS